SVQQALEEAVLAFCAERATVQGAGRTDAGVHASGQVCHLDLARPQAASTVQDALNFHLRGHPVAVLDCAEASPDFHARFSATGRYYRYRILNRRAPPVLERGRVWWVAQPLDATRMAEAAQRLVGRHDFTSFRASLCQARSPVKTLDRLSVSSDGGEIIIEAEARSFLHHQVRNMVGTLKQVGAARWTADDVTRALAARDRKAGGPTAPPEGLYLMAVGYDGGPPPASDDADEPAGDCDAGPAPNG
ncbi:MAG: tRNA pseudouridine(38-40) synthase TruA, partial [Proteobacteria bacterium]|nr:tRNA pseudouridine(38-40) synthase TruA [Pseudomonadota bacterium]